MRVGSHTHTLIYSRMHQFVVTGSTGCGWLKRCHSPTFWCTLYDNHGIKIGECRVVWNPRYFYPRLPEEYYITDVWVHAAFRGNGYCGLLLLNVMDHFDRRTGPERDKIFTLATHLTNIPARRVYEQIFGYPGTFRHGLLYFSTQTI